MSYLGVDLDKCKVLFKADSMTSACLISALEYEAVTHCIFPLERQSADQMRKDKRILPKFLAIREMELIWENLGNPKWEGTMGGLMDVLQTALFALPDDSRTAFKLQTMAGPEPLSVDIGMPERNVQPLVKLPSAPVKPSAPPIPSAPGSPWLASAPAAPAIPSVPPIPTAPKLPSAPPKAPSPAGATGKVWAIADDTYAFIGALEVQADLKAFRKKVIESCEKQGINSGTAATQFGKWKASKGL